jgi:hypothetical protein
MNKLCDNSRRRLIWKLKLVFLSSWKLPAFNFFPKFFCFLHKKDSYRINQSFNVKKLLRSLNCFLLVDRRFQIRIQIGILTNNYWWGSVSVAGSFNQQAKTVRKTLILTVLCLLVDFLSLKNYVNVPSKSKKQKFFYKNFFFVGILKVNDENSRIRIRIWIRIQIY